MGAGDHGSGGDNLDVGIVNVGTQGDRVVTTVDFFYPLIDDAETMGAIAVANVISDLYAVGASPSSLVMIIGAPKSLPTPARLKVTAALMRGFRRNAEAAGVPVVGGQTILSPWPMIGGSATAFAPASLPLVLPSGLRAGAVLVLTKALGIQAACNAPLWHRRGAPADRLAACAAVGLDAAAAARLRDAAAAQMARVNKAAGGLLRAHGALACTDVTGFGLLGHAAAMADASGQPVRCVISALPCLAPTAALDAALGGALGLRAGTAAETSGGLLVALPSAAAAAAYAAAVAAADGAPAWVVGRVEGRRAGEAAAVMDPAVAVIDVMIGVIPPAGGARARL